MCYLQLADVEEDDLRRYYKAVHPLLDVGDTAKERRKGQGGDTETLADMGASKVEGGVCEVGT